MNSKEMNRALIDMSDRIEKLNQTTDWLKAAREKEFNQPAQQVAPPQPVAPIATPQNKYETLTPAKIKQQFELRGEEYLNETIAELGKLYPDQPHQNKTKTLPPPLPPKTHEQILELVKSGYSNEDILARFES
jgi:ATP/maltotriose-dependent transcriptional regulator MalT